MDNTTLTIIWTVIGIILFPIILKNKAPYGRHTTKKWGKTISNKTGWIIMELPALLICPLFYFTNTTNLPSLNTFFVGLWIIHYINRTIIFPFRIKTKGKKMPLAIALSAIFFNTINGVINGYFLSVTDYSFSNSLLILTGFFIFFIGLVLNIYSDNKLISLRENTQVNNYAIPKGGLFNKISCPNFFGELTEWFGFALMTFNIGSLSFFVWTFINLVPRALSHHNWYKINFENYPKNRKAIIPYIL
tara:strand:- start:285 stop:1025 length:741 start_codon:yes stop_codon:yes gene_type:complete